MTWARSPIDPKWRPTSISTGAGLRLGLEAERFYCAVPVKLYMKGFTSLMAGEFDATYQQTVQNNSGYGVDTGWTAGPDCAHVRL